MIKGKKRSRLGFPIAMLVYALVVLIVAAVGLDHLWSFLDNYEQSRPHVALDAYMAQLDKEYVADRSEDLIDSIDHSVQTEEQCRQVILDALSDKFTCAKKSKESTEDTYVYALRCGKQVIGTMTMTRTGETLGKFTAWEIASDSFDLSFLKTDAISITVPSEFSVYSLGNKLGASHITQSGIPYPLLENFYADYDLPTMVTYTAGPFLGSGSLTVEDTAGQAVTIDSDTDMDQFADNCTEQEISALDSAAQGFIQSYVDFTSCTGNDTMGNYNRLKQHMVTGGELAKRMYEAIVGLYWVTDRHATVRTLDIHHFVRLSDDRWLCNLTYVVDTTDFAGSIEAASTLNLIFLQTEDGLKAESMIRCD